MLGLSCHLRSFTLLFIILVAFVACGSSSSGANVFPPSGWQETYNNPLNSPKDSDWDVQDNGCQYTPQGLLFVSPSTNFCSSVNKRVSENFGLQATFSIHKGKESGIVFNVHREFFPDGTHTMVLYYASITTDQHYKLTFHAKKGDDRLLQEGKSDVIHAGLNIQNTVAVTRKGTNLCMFVNGRQVICTTLQDTNHAMQGGIGVAVANYTTPPSNPEQAEPTETLFQNVKVYEPKG